MATIIEYYEVHKDGWCLDQHIVARFLSKNAAESFVATNPKSYYMVPTPKKLIVFDTPQEFFDQRNDNIKQNALAKLTDAERLALGV